MGLVTREGKGSKLTIQEMDGNLTYLDNIVGVKDSNKYESLAVTTEQILSTTLIPANTFSDLDAVQLKVLLFKTGTNGTLGLTRAYINTVPTLSGASVFVELSENGSNLASVKLFFLENFYSIIKSGKIKGTPQYNSGAGNMNTLRSKQNQSIPVEIPFDFTVDNYIINAVTLASTLDTITQESLVFKKIN